MTAGTRCSGTPRLSHSSTSQAWASRFASTERRTASCGCRCPIVESLVPCSRLIFAVLAPVVPALTVRPSSTATETPARASSTAVVRPVSPAPTTATSTVSGGAGPSVCGPGAPSRHIDNAVMRPGTPCPRPHTAGGSGRATPTASAIAIASPGACTFASLSR